MLIRSRFLQFDVLQFFLVINAAECTSTTLYCVPVRDYPNYLICQICVLQWEEIKTKKSEPLI